MVFVSKLWQFKKRVKENCRLTSIMKFDMKILNNLLSKKLKYIKKIEHYTQVHYDYSRKVGLLQNRRTIKVIGHNNKYNQNHLIISEDSEKIFHKMQHRFLLKTGKNHREENCSIICKRKAKDLSKKGSGKKQGFLLSYMIWWEEHLL